MLLDDEHANYNVPKEAFLTRLREFFDDFKTDIVPTEKLQIFPGACCNKPCNPHLPNFEIHLNSTDANRHT